MTKLPRVTVALTDCFYYGEAIAAIKKSLTKIEPARTLFLTDIDAYSKSFPFELIKIPKISSKKEYSEFIIKKLDKHFDTDFVLVIQHDGWVLDDLAWSDEFYEYDYIGAPWLETDGYNVGNGGFSLRSKRLQHILATDDYITINHSAEDVIICRLYRPYLEEKYGIKFAPEELAERFSFELREPTQSTFGFHGKFHKPFKPTVIVKRDAALGDIIATEPLLDYFHKKDYNVVIDMPIHLSMFFGTHFFPIKHISQIDGRVAERALKVDLNMSYENNPKQLHLKSYYEAALVTDGEIKNPKLNFPVDTNTRFFKKYCILHIDDREQASRNIYGVEWEVIVKNLKERGYVVIQVGQREHDEIEGAVQFNTVTTHMLLYAVAGSSLFIGIDSGVSNMAVACGIRSVIFSGSVAPEYIYPDLSKIEIVTKEKCCDNWRCWSSIPGNVNGVECYIDVDMPPCVQYNNEEVLTAIDKVLTK